MRNRAIKSHFRFKCFNIRTSMHPQIIAPIMTLHFQNYHSVATTHYHNSLTALKMAIKRVTKKSRHARRKLFIVLTRENHIIDTILKHLEKNDNSYRLSLCTKWLLRHVMTLISRERAMLIDDQLLSSSTEDGNDRTDGHNSRYSDYHVRSTQACTSICKWLSSWRRNRRSLF